MRTDDLLGLASSGFLGMGHFDWPGGLAWSGRMAGFIRENQERDIPNGHSQCHACRDIRNVAKPFLGTLYIFILLLPPLARPPGPGLTPNFPQKTCQKNSNPTR
jgi:hypothetical protein